MAKANLGAVVGTVEEGGHGCWSWLVGWLGIERNGGGRQELRDCKMASYLRTETVLE